MNTEYKTQNHLSEPIIDNNFQEKYEMIRPTLIDIIKNSIKEFTPTPNKCRIPISDIMDFIHTDTDRQKLIYLLKNDKNLTGLDINIKLYNDNGWNIRVDWGHLVRSRMEGGPLISTDPEINITRQGYEVNKKIHSIIMEQINF